MRLAALCLRLQWLKRYRAAPSCCVGSMDATWGGANNAERIVRPSFNPAVLLSCFLALLTITRASEVVAAPRGPHRRKPQILAEFNIRKDGSQLFLTARVNGTPRRFVVDTGAVATLFRPGLRASLGERPRIVRERIDGVRLKRIEVFPGPSIQIGAATPVAPFELACADVPFFRMSVDYYGEAVDGILGMDVLAACVFSIDFDAGKLRFHTEAEPAFGRAVPIIRDDELAEGCPMVPVAIDGRPAEPFLIDTGFCSMTTGGLSPRLYEQLAKERRLAALSPSYPGVSLTAGGTGTVVDKRLSKVSVAGYIHNGPIFSQFSVNCLGLGYLSRYSVAFDFPNSMMYLRPGKAFTQPDLYNLAGLAFSRKDGVLYVNCVYKESAGAAAGIKSGDALVLINGHPVDRMTLYALERILSTEGRHVLVIRRGGTARRMTLTLIAGEKAIQVR